MISSLKPLSSNCAVLFAALLALVSSGRVAAQSYWNLGAAPTELVSYGYTNGTMLFDDDRAAYYVAEFVPYAGYEPPEIAIATSQRPAPSAATPPATVPSSAARRGRAADTASSRRIDLYVDLSHYSRESLHNEAVHGSRNNGIVVVAFTGEEEARAMHRIIVDHVRSGAQIRSVMRAAPEAGMRFDIYYNGISLFRSKSSRPPVRSLEAELKPIVELQSIDIRIAEKQKEIDDLDRKLEAMDRAFELGDDPDIND